MAKQIIGGQWTLITAPATIRLVNNQSLSSPLKLDWREAGEVPNEDSLYSIYTENKEEPLQTAIDFYIRSSNREDIEIDIFTPVV